MNSKTKSALLESGTILNGKWEILDHIATGGMAEVYRGRQINLDREVAVKIISEEFLASFEENEEEKRSALDRFHREVRIMAQVRHANVLQVYDHDHAVVESKGEKVSIEYIVMEYVPGPNLRSTMPEEGLRGNEKRLCEWIDKFFMPILAALETVHSLGVVHRDLKPENVLLEDHVPKIMDFGLAGGPRWRGITQSHHAFGTLNYMAPEQFMEMGETDARADIYSLGKILYETVAGRMKKETAFIFKPARLANPDTRFLKSLDRIIRKATTEDKAQRTPSVDLLRRSLVSALEETGYRFAGTGGFLRRTPRAARYIAVAVLLLVVTGSILFHILYHREKTSVSPSGEETLSESIQDAKEIQPGPGMSIHSPWIIGKDQTRLRFVSGGEITLPKSARSLAGREIEVSSFYMDETEVTNHQYVEFLNEMLPRVRVEQGTVKKGEKIWLYLGEVFQGHEPILFREGRFRIGEPAYASHPVVRITAYGAREYARFYGRRLATTAEWYYAMEKGNPVPSPSEVETTLSTPSGMMGMDDMHRRMHGTEAPASDRPAHPPDSEKTSTISGVSTIEPNTFGIRGLGENVREWVLGWGLEEVQKSYLVLGKWRSEKESARVPVSIMRHPWEAFEDVGFRCALTPTDKRTNWSHD